MIGTFSDVGFDVYDFIVVTARVFFWKQFKLQPYPKFYWVMNCCIHHPLAMTLVVPLNLNYSHLTSFHQIATATLMAGALCYFVGAFKNTRDVTAPKDFRDFQV